MLGNQGIQTRNGCHLKILYLREDLDILDHVKGVFRPLLFFQFHLALWMVNTCEYHNQKIPNKCNVSLNSATSGRVDHHGLFLLLTQDGH